MLLDSGQPREGTDACDASRAEIASLHELAERWFATVGDALDALRSIRSLFDVRDGIPPLAEIHRRKRIPLMSRWTSDAASQCSILAR